MKWEMLYLTIVPRSVSEVCNFEFGPFYNYPFSVSACVRSGPGHDHFFRPIIAIIGPRTPGWTSLWASLCSDPAPAPSLSPSPAYHCRVIVGLINFAGRKISQPKQGCYVRASAIRLHHLPELKTMVGAGKAVTIWAEIAWAWLENLF